MSEYLDQMTQLVVSGDLDSDDPKPRTKMTARAITINALRQLNSERKGQLLRFLYEGGLIGGCRSFDRKTGKPNECSGQVIVDLSTAKLDKARPDSPKPLYLQNAVLNEAVLDGARLQNTSLNNASMRNAKLRSADLSNAVLAGANLSLADLRNASLVAADLRNANLKGAKVAGANFQDAKYNTNTQFPDNINLGIMHECNLEDKSAEKKVCKL